MTSRPDLPPPPQPAYRPLSPLFPFARFLVLVIALAALVLGAVVGWIGAEIVMLGGTWYYALAGLGLIGAAVLLALRRHWTGVLLLGLVFAGTLAWSLAEIAAKGFMPSWGFDLAGRAGVVLALFGLALLVLLFGTRRVFAPAFFRPLGWFGVAVAVLVPAGLIAGFWERPRAASDTAAAPAFTPLPGHNPAGEWWAFGGSALGARFTASTQISSANVANLTEAWRMQSGDLSPSERVFFSSQNTPVYAEERLYVCTSSNIVHALDPATGAEIWRFDPDVPVPAMESQFSVACRGVGYYQIPEAEAGAECGGRIYLATVDSRLIALDSATGAICPAFGAAGTVDLALGLDMQEMGFASSSSGPAVVGDLLVVGQQVSDNQRRDAPSGVVRAYDAASGDLVWAWDALRQGIAAQPLAEGEVYPRGTPNVWNVISGDLDAGIVYIGTGNSANDHWGATRTEEEDRFTSAVVAIDMETGETIWDYSTVIHDLWDYDIGAQPALIDMEIEGETRRVVVQGTKTGSIFILDALTGELLTPVEQRPAPQGALPGDWVSETQPQSVAFQNFAGHPGPDPEVLDASHAWGVAMFDAAQCRRDFHRLDYRGIYTPPSENPEGILLHPGTIGGMNWGGVGLDLARQIVVTNHSRMPNLVVMHPRDQVSDLPVGDGGARPDQSIAPHWLSPWGVTRPMWLSSLGAPCIAPPWGYLSASDLRTGEMLWTQPLGTGYDTGPMGMPTFLRIPLGTANIGGPLTTVTGLTFIAAAQDDFFRAYETTTGRLLWSARLPAGAQASPMSFEHQGRQYVVVVATGHERLETSTGDFVLAYALPE